MRVLIYGGTGSQAQPLAHHLLTAGHEPYVLTRRSSPPESMFGTAVHFVQGDLGDPASLEAATRGMDAVSFLIPAFLSDRSKIFTYVESAMRAAVEAGVNVVVWNTSSRMPEPTEARWHSNPLPALREVIQKMGVPLITVAPVKYVENLLGPWTANSVRASNRVSYPVLANQKVGWISAWDVSALIAQALQRPQLAGSVFRVSGIEAVTGPQLAAAFSDVLGRPISYYPMSPSEMQAAVTEVYGPEMGAGLAEAYRQDQTDPHAPPRYHDMTQVLQQLPVRMTTIREWIAKNAVAFST